MPTKWFIKCYRIVSVVHLHITDFILQTTEISLYIYIPKEKTDNVFILSQVYVTTGACVCRCINFEICWLFCVIYLSYFQYLTTVCSLNCIRIKGHAVVRSGFGSQQFCYRSSFCVCSSIQWNAVSSLYMKLFKVSFFYVFFLSNGDLQRLLIPCHRCHMCSVTVVFLRIPILVCMFNEVKNRPTCTRSIPFHFNAFDIVPQSKYS